MDGTALDEYAWILTGRIQALSNADLFDMAFQAARDVDGDARDMRQCDGLLERELRRRLADWLREAKGESDGQVRRAV